MCEGSPEPAGTRSSPASPEAEAHADFIKSAILFPQTSLYKEAMGALCNTCDVVIICLVVVELSVNCHYP